ncbi:MAG: heparinase II/III family protein [Clostridia bacterium]|nr:heparinase II/III family protein [Clostridia bacterium]
MKKKFIAVSVSLILILLSIGICTNVAAAGNGVTLIYSCLDFEEQNEGDAPYGFYGADTTYFSVAKQAADGNQNNKALRLTATKAISPVPSTQIPFHYAPIADRFVVSLRFKNTDSASTKRIMLTPNANEPKSSLYLSPVGDSCNLMSLESGILYICERNTSRTPALNQWHTIEFEINVSTRKVIPYLDGTKLSSGLELPATGITNIAALRFFSPAASGTWYIDDINVYLGNSKLSAADFAAQKSLYENSDIIPDHKYELGRLYQYDKFVYATLYNKFVTRVDGARYYKNNAYHNLQAPVTDDIDSVIHVPVRDFAEAFGGSFSGTGDTATVSGGGKTMQFTVGSNAYSQDGVMYTALDTLSEFFGISYYRNGDLLSFGEELTCPFSLGKMGENFRGYTMEGEVFERIANSLVYKRPTKEQILAAFESYNPQHSYPRLLINDFSEIINNRSRDAGYDSTVSALITRADNYVNLDPVAYTKSDGLRGDFPQPLNDRCTYLSFAYKITGDAKYKNALWSNLEAVASFPDLNPKHFLDIGISANGIKFAYDWLYNDWTPQQRQTIETIILDKIFEPAIYAYRSPKGADETGFAYSTGNQPIIINCGIAGCALSLLDKYPDICSEVISCSLRSVETCLSEFAPDGAWTEGVAYWQDTMGSLPALVNIYRTALGDDFGLLNTPGLHKSAYFPLAVSNGTATFPMGDDASVSPYHPSLMWFANVYNDMALATMRKNHLYGASLTDVVNWVFDADPVHTTIDNDNYFRKMETASMRKGWNSGDTVAILHGGQNNTNHGHLDNGTFQIDMLGQRWACEVPAEKYNILHYGSETYDPSAPASPYKPEDYYRFKAEGHNTVIANLGGERADQVPEAFAKMLKFTSTDAGSYAILDMTQTNNLYTNAKRGLMLDKENNTVIVQDDFKASEETEFWWFMHTQASITLSADSKTATLNKNAKTIRVSIISDGDETFQILPAKAMDGYYNVPPLQGDNSAYKKLAVTKTTDHFKLSVAFSTTETDEPPKYKPMEEWSFGEDIPPASDDYTVKGIADGDRFAISASDASSQKVYVVDKDAAGLAPSAATKLASAEFYVDGALVGTASSAPYCCNVPLTEGNHTLRVVAHTTGVYSYDIGTYNYSAEVWSDTSDSVIEDFDGGTQGADVSFGTKTIVSTEACTYQKAPGTGSMAMTFSSDVGSGQSYISTGKIAIPESKLLTLDYDFYSENSSGNAIAHHLRDEQSTPVVQGATFGFLGSGKYSKNEWHHVSYIFDFESEEFRGYLDGYEIERGVVKATSKNNAYVRFYINRYSLGTVYVDNFRYCAKGEAVQIEATPYAVKGIADGERIPVCAKAKSLKRIISIVDASAASRTITNATNLAKAEFYIDGVKAATVTSKPCQWNLPITDLKTHTLTVETTDAGGNKQNFGPYSYTAYNMADGATSYTEYFDGAEGTAVTKDNLSRIATFTTNENPVFSSAAGGDGTALKLTTSNGKRTNLQSNCDILVPEDGITTYDFDFYCTSGSEYYKIYFHTRNSGGFNMKNENMTILDNLQMNELQNNTWHHVSYVFDSSRNEYMGAIDGYEFVRGAMDSRTPGRAVYFLLQTQSYTSCDFYLDNVEIMSKTVSQKAVAGVEYDGNTANVVVLNGGSALKKFNVLSAEYKDNKLKDISAYAVELKSKEIWQDTQSTMSAGEGRKAVYIWDTNMNPLAKSSPVR